MSPLADFGAFVCRHGGNGRLVAQPRMGFGDPAEMRAGLLATRHADATTAGTITLDSYTRVGDLGAAERGLRQGNRLNGYPIVTHDPATTVSVLDGLGGADFPVQVRHGSAVPGDIFTALAALGITATEGGPASYCLPYGRTPLADSVYNWRECTRRYAELRGLGADPHLETFGGCMMGQLCPPSQLVAMSILEALFFCHNGITSVSVSYAQQTAMSQDVEAVCALRRLCAELLPTPNWHVVIYAYMGLYPTTDHGAYRLLGDGARLALRTGSERIIAKTVAEPRRLPTVTENVAALEHVEAVVRQWGPAPIADSGRDTQTYHEALALVTAVLDLDADIGTALLRAFARGYLDIPYCLHPDNMGRTRSYIDTTGWLRWADVGALPLRGLVSTGGGRRVSSSNLLADLSYVRRTYDNTSILGRCGSSVLDPAREGSWTVSRGGEPS